MSEAGGHGACHGARPRRIVWEGPQYETQSLALVNRALCARLVERGHEVSLATFESEAVRAAAGPLPAALADRVGAELSGPPDLVVRHQWPPNFGSAGGARLAVIQPWEFGSLPAAWIEPIEREVDAIWVPTPWVRDCYVSSGVDPERVHVVTNGVDPAEFSPAAAPIELPSEPGFKFLFVGGAIHRKGIDVLLAAYARAFTRRDDVSLVVKGMGAESFYRGQTLDEAFTRFESDPNAPELVVLDEEIPSERMPGLYAACDALVHPYRGEGFGLPIAEAMSCALPAVVTGAGAALAFCDEAWAFTVPAARRDFDAPRVGQIRTVGTPWLAEPDEDALVDILRRVFDDRVEARRRGYAAREQIRTRFTWEHAVDQLEERIDALLVAPARSASRAHQADGADDRSGATRIERSTPVLWSASPFNYSGYARISRTLLPELERRGHAVELDAFGTDPRFAKAFDQQLAREPHEAALWQRILERKTEGGVGVCFHPPVAWDGYGFFEAFRRDHPRRDGYVGFTMFETDRLPRHWADECNQMDEVWVPSEFNREVFAESGVLERKIRVFHPGIDPAPFLADVPPYEIPGRRSFAFLSVFQWTLRKGWDVLLGAWARAFGPDDDVCLVVRAYPGNEKHPPIRQRIDDYLRSIGSGPEHCAPILWIDEFIDDERMPALYAAADAFVLPTRGEAWGLPFLEAMASGLPAVAPAWSGHLQFMNADNSYLVDIDGLEAVPASMEKENAYYTPELRWSSPSVEHTADTLRRIFEDPDAARAVGLRAQREVQESWCVEAAVPSFAERVEDLGRRAPSRGRAPEAIDEPARVFWNAPLFDPSGYADEARNFVLGLDALDVPTTTKPIAWSDRRAELGRREFNRLRALEMRPLGSDVVHVQHIFANHFRPTPEVRATVGRTMFETDSLPAGWAEACNQLDEIWVPSAFNVETFARAGVDPDKLEIVPGSFDADRFRKPAEPFEIEGRRSFAFLSLFDWGQRKGWDVLLRAWAEAFHADDDVCLLLKTSSSGGLRPRELESRVRRFLKKRCGRRPEEVAPILWMDGDHASHEMPGVYRSADAYVMPSRGEGWGRPYMEAMACGLPTIATGWGGHTEYMHSGNSALLEYDLAPVSKAAVREAPQFQGHRWAEPRAEHLVEWLRRIAGDPAAARALGDRARSEVLERLDRKVVARRVLERIEAVAPVVLSSDLRTRVAAAAPTAAAGAYA